MSGPELTLNQSPAVREQTPAATTQSGEKVVLCARQHEITVHFNEAGDLVLIQSAWLDDDVAIVISRANIPDFIDRLTDALGIPSIGGSR
jgi:hypothetical protein